MNCGHVSFCAFGLLVVFLIGGCSGGDSGSGSRDELAALAPAELTLRDIAATRLPALPDTVGKGIRRRAMYHWVLSLHTFNERRWEETLEHLGDARTLYADVTQQEEDWHARFRNMEAACRYMLEQPGRVKKHGEPLAAPRVDSILDVHYEWILALDALREGDRETAVRHLQIVSESKFLVAPDSRLLLGRLEALARSESSEAAR